MPFLTSDALNIKRVFFYTYVLT